MIQLPSFTFLNAPPRSGKSTLAHLLDMQDVALVHCSFAEPLRNALFGTFYPGELGDSQTMDLRDPATKIKPVPCVPSWTNEQFLIDYGTWLKSKTNEFILGDLAKAHIQRIMDYYIRFVYDDARTMGDIAPFINAFGVDNCALIHIERLGATWRTGDVGGDLLHLPAIRHVMLTNNGKPEAMLGQLAVLMGGSAPSAPKVPHDAL
jgi:hypothetical protein